MYELGTLSFTRPLQRFVMPLLNYRQADLLSIFHALNLRVNITCNPHMLNGRERKAIRRSVTPLFKDRKNRKAKTLTRNQGATRVEEFVYYRREQQILSQFDVFKRGLKLRGRIGDPSQLTRSRIETEDFPRCARMKHIAGCAD